MTDTQFSTTTKVFHWLTALLILTIIPLGVIASRIDPVTDQLIAQKTLLFSIHKTMGVAVFIVALARIAYALTQTKPAPLHPDRRLETALAEVVHWLLYLSLVLVPLSGWIHHSAAAVAAPIWIPFANSLPFVPVNPTVSDLFGGLHWLWSKIMVAAILLHLSGALKHLLIDKDASLRRMWFGQTSVVALTSNANRIPAIVAISVYAAATAFGVGLGAYSPSASQQSSRLETPQSGWTVTSGQIGLTITQLGNPISGSFKNWTAAIDFDETAVGVAGTVNTTIDIGSLQLGSVTNQAMGHDFFDQSVFPTAQFIGELISQGGEHSADGILTIKDHSHPLSFPFELNIDGNTSEMAATVSLNRTDFGIGGSITDEANLANTVALTLSVIATR